MRMYETFYEVMSEVKRDLKELAIVYQSESVQNFDTSQDDGYRTHELMNYSFTLNTPHSAIDWYLDEDGEYRNATEEQIDYLYEEFGERVRASITEGPETINPGKAYLLDKDYWEPMLVDGKFHYTYNERLRGSIDSVVDLLWKDKSSRRGWIPIWQPLDNDHLDTANLARVPCSLGYYFMVRNDRVHMHYIMRSCDFTKHFAKDVALAVMMQEWMMHQVPGHHSWGTFTFTAFSLHAFAKDLEGVF
jgi:thymidylate synthase